MRTFFAGKEKSVTRATSHCFGASCIYTGFYQKQVDFFFFDPQMIFYIEISPKILYNIWKNKNGWFARRGANKETQTQ